MGDQYLTLGTSLARVVAAQLHAADVDRLINVYNTLKIPEHENQANENQTISRILKKKQSNANHNCNVMTYCS